METETIQTNHVELQSILLDLRIAGRQSKNAE